MELLEEALQEHRVLLHKSKNNNNKDGMCVYDKTCQCKCAVCTKVMFEPLRRAAVCPYDDLPQLTCVMEKCPECGLEKALGCPREVAKGHFPCTYTKMAAVTKQVPGMKPKVKQMPVSHKTMFSAITDEIKSDWSYYILHHYFAKRSRLGLRVGTH